MLKPPIARFIGIPYLERASEFDGADCWGVVQLYLRDMAGIDLPGFLDVGNQTTTESLKNLAEGQTGWSVADPPYRTLDVLLFRVGRTLHAGVVVDEEGRMLNARKGSGSVISDVSERIWMETLIDGYRYSR